MKLVFFTIQILRNLSSILSDNTQILFYVDFMFKYHNKQYFMAPTSIMIGDHSPNLSSQIIGQTAQIPSCDGCGCLYWTFQRVERMSDDEARIGLPRVFGRLLRA